MQMDIVTNTIYHYSCQCLNYNNGFQGKMTGSGLRCFYKIGEWHTKASILLLVITQYKACESISYRIIVLIANEIKILFFYFFFKTTKFKSETIVR